MSETAPERSSGGNVFTRKVGPLSLWVWMLIALGLALAYYLYKKQQTANTGATSSAGSANTPGGVDASLVPQFVNQTYVENNPTPGPPVKTPGPPPIKHPGPKPQHLTRTWQAIGTDSTMEQVAARLGQFENGKSTGDPTKLHPANKIAENFVKNVYPKNHNAKIPKGAEFTYEEGTVTSG